MPHPDDIDEVAARLETAFATVPALSDATAKAVIRIVPGKRAILRGTLGARNVVFRLLLDDNSTASEREWAEMIRIWPYMNAGDLRVAEPLHYAPEHHLIVIEEVPGMPLMEALYEQAPEDRTGHMQAPAAWLRQYTQATERSEENRAAHWLKRAETAAAAQPYPRLLRREGKVIKHLRRLLDVASDQPWRVTISHGDFHPNNLILNGARLTGIDLGGSSRLPIYKDIARFLVHMGRRGLLPSGAARFGVDREGFDAFSEAFALSDWERKIALPFMIGVEALLRVEGPSMSRARIRRAAAMYDLLIPDLRQLSQR